MPPTPLTVLADQSHSGLDRKALRLSQTPTTSSPRTCRRAVCSKWINWYQTGKACFADYYYWLLTGWLRCLHEISEISHSPFLILYLTFPPSLSLCLFLTPSLSLSPPRSLNLRLFVPLCPFLCLFPSLSLCLCLSVCLSVCLSHSLTHSLPFNLYCFFQVRFNIKKKIWY